MHKSIHAFALLFASCVAMPALAKNLYRCERDGVAQYQDTPCGVDASVRRVDAASSGYQAPSVTPPSHGASGWEQQERDTQRMRNVQDTNRAPTVSSLQRDVVADEPGSFRCTAADGRVFYRHGGCPTELEGPLQTVVRSDFPNGPYGAPSYYTDYEYTRTPVSSETVSRAEACAEINRPSAGGRRGSDEDSKVDTYDKNLGRDPCAR